MTLFTAIVVRAFQRLRTVAIVVHGMRAAVLAVRRVGSRYSPYLYGTGIS